MKHTKYIPSLIDFVDSLREVLGLRSLTVESASISRKKGLAKKQLRMLTNPKINLDRLRRSQCQN